MANQPQTENISISQHVVYICSRFIAYSLPLFFFLVVNSFYLKTYDSAQIKITFTQIGASTLALTWLVKILVQGRLPFSRKDLLYLAPFLLFLISCIAVWLHAPYKQWALEESLRRVFYMVLALVTVSEMNTDERLKRLWRWLIAAAWVAIGYGVLQYIDLRFSPAVPSGLDPFIWRGAFGPRVFSTFGNPNFYGNFLVIMTPIILASVLREKSSLVRPILSMGITLLLVLIIDKGTIGLGGSKIDPSLRIVFDALIVAFTGLLVYSCVSRIKSGTNLPMYLLLFSLLVVNIYATETKGAWIGIVAAIGAFVLLVFEYFLHFEERIVEPKKYMTMALVLTGLMTLVLGIMVAFYVLPWFRGLEDQIGFQILWIPTLLFTVLAVITVLWIFSKPWNLKKLIYGMLVLFIITLGGGVLYFAQKRLQSVSFRLFTWISTWEMIRTTPLLGNGVGSFKIIYPAFRRPEIIVLEGRSNTETDHAEDEYLEVWQDEGFVGFGIFLWMVFTALFLGFKQLRWFSTHRAQDGPRAYELLGYLGAYIGALIHWTMDVSIRFVSSGVFSGFLPGVLVAYARNHDRPVINEVTLSYDRWIRVGLVGFWTVILLWLGVELVPQSFIQNGDTTTGQIWFWTILTGASLFVLIELLERGNKVEKPGKFVDQYGDVNPRFFAPRLVLLPFVFIICGWTVRLAYGHFKADVHHNLAIFFSKEAIWNKSPMYDARVMNLPPDIREKYQAFGGALEHYEQVVSHNKGFPMAHYFTGNVYNDWGSQVHSESMNLRAQGKMDEALRLKTKALDMWNKSEASYNATKALAPNYVQSHHQVGLLNVKRAELAAQWGDYAESRRLYMVAYDNFKRYRMLDPVFVPNLDRMAQILLMDGKVHEVIELYEKGLYYNNDVAKLIHGQKINHFGDRVASIAVSLAKLNFNQVSGRPNPFNPPLPEIQKAIEYFKLATVNDPKSLEAWKGLGFMLEKVGKGAEAQEAYRKAIELAPNDPDLKRR